MIGINTRTQLCGVLGNPVEHSLSPAIHNAAFQKLGLNYVYLAFRVIDLPAAIGGLRALGNVRGLSVTIPHKVAIIPHLDDVESTAKHIGSVNAVVVENGRLIGYNTDASGALRALTNAGVSVKGRRIMLLGSGGAARAVAFALGAEGDPERLTILGIDEAERSGLVRDLQAKTQTSIEQGPLNDETLRLLLPYTDVLIHCTPVGMHPNVAQSCVPPALLTSSLTVMDIVYNPLETQLLKEAKEAGCRTIRGLDMFLNQAVLQFELWTGCPAPADVMRTILETHFS